MNRYYSSGVNTWLFSSIPTISYIILFIKFYRHQVWKCLASDTQMHNPEKEQIDIDSLWVENNQSDAFENMLGHDMGCSGRVFE